MPTPESRDAASAVDVPMPPDDASPEQVVRSYVDAVHAEDCDTAEALMTRPSGSWCGNIDITSLEIRGRWQERKESEAGDGPMVEYVSVEIATRGGSAPMPDGTHRWGYLLERAGGDGPWWIYDQGVG